MRIADIVTRRTHRLDEIEVGGEVDGSDLMPDGHDFTPKQLTLFPKVPSEPTLPKEFELVGRIRHYYVARRLDNTSDGYSRKGADQEYTYYVFDSGTPVAFVATLHPDSDFGDAYPGRRHRDPELEGAGLRMVAIHVSQDVRGPGLAAQMVKWLLENVCDYIISDDRHTRDGVAMWRQLVRDSRFEVWVFNYNKHEYYRVKPGATWSNVYRSYNLYPFITLAGKGEDILPD